jgi:hypothetical protein
MPPEQLPETQIKTPELIIKMPTPRQQSWGAVISIVVIVLMIIIGAFYAWGKRISEGNVPSASTTAQ